MKEIKNQCTAKSKQSGERCRRHAAIGKKVCKIHGGASTGAPKENKNTVKHGIYSKFYTEEEVAILDSSDLAIQSVQEELKLTRIQLYRAIKKQYEIDDKLTLMQVVDNFGAMVESGGAVEKSEVRGKTDHHAVIDRYLGRIQTLIKLERELTQVTDAQNEPEYDNEYTLAPDEPTPEGGAVL